MGAQRKDSGDEFNTHEFPMSDRDFQRIKKVAHESTGITLNDNKKNMIYSRLARRLRRLDVRLFSDYCKLIEQKNSPELVEFTNAITTNLTSFFRENHHFEFLQDNVLPALIKSCCSSKKIRIWSAGCSTGEEPYSIAMVCRSFRNINNWDVKILATDLDSNVVSHAKSGSYNYEKADGIPDQYRKYLDWDSENGLAQIKPEIQQLITFKQLNLLQKWPMKGHFDIIFCRNVVIYFDKNTQQTLFERYADILKESGKLFIGHSENLHGISSRFSSLGRTIYERSG